jgi:CheY-like chemotaxis protein
MVKILVVDDAEFFRKLFSQELTQAGFTVIEAQNGREAIEKMRSEKPRLVLMDLVMPEMTGAEALAVIKKDESIKTIPVLMLTSIAAEIRGEDLLLQGAVGYLEKDSVTPGDVVAKLQEILGTSQERLDPTKA